MNKIVEFAKNHTTEIAITGGVAFTVGAAIVLKKKPVAPKVYSNSIPWNMYGDNKDTVERGLKLAQTWLNKVGKYVTTYMAFSIFPNNPAEIESCVDILKSHKNSDGFAVCIMALNK